MAITPTVLIEATAISNSETTQYTSTNVKTLIDKFTAVNYTSATTPAAVAITVRLVASGGAAGDTNAVVLTKTLQAGETYTFPEVVGHVLNAGDFISTLAGAASSISIRASGRIVT